MVANFAPDILDQLKDCHLICLETVSPGIQLNDGVLFSWQLSIAGIAWILAFGGLHVWRHRQAMCNLFVHFSDLV